MKRAYLLMVVLVGIPLACFVTTSRAEFGRIQDIEALNHGSGKLGVYRALLIGIDDYRDPQIPDLETAVNDAKTLAGLLAERYGFQTKLLLNRDATRENIFINLRELAASAGEDDNVLIYYAGHGELDRLYNDGWWVPADAEAGRPITYMDNAQVQKAMRSMKARHVLLISDSCYSGTLFGRARAMPPAITDKYYLSLYNERSRWGMTSGNKQPVSDQGTAGHSVFAYQVLKALKKNERPYLSTQELYTAIAPIVSNNSEQTPVCRPIRNTGDQGGEFIFVASSGATVDEPSTSRTGSTLTVNAGVSGAEVFVDGRKVGRTPLEGVAISPGSHEIEVNKSGYETYEKRIEIAPGRSMSLYVDLTEKQPAEGRLFVDTVPEDAGVRVLNVAPKYHRGMALKPGRYEVEVSKDGYEAEKRWITLSAGEDKYVDMRLEETKRGRGHAFTNSLGMKFVYIPPGTFMMGSPPDEPGRDDDEKQHRVRLTKGFYMQTTEVTVGQWRTFIRETGYKTQAETGGGAYTWTGSKWEKREGSYWDNPGFDQTDDHPVTCVSWNDVQKFIDWLNEKENQQFRLPTEAEWEYAARSGGKSEKYAGGNNIDRLAWYGDNSGGRTHEVGTKAPNGLGIYDMSGNVWEWCQDWYGDYPSASVTNPSGPSSGSLRVGRGGSWYGSARLCRSAVRGRDEPGGTDNGLGFRLSLRAGGQD